VKNQAIAGEARLVLRSASAIASPTIARVSDAWLSAFASGLD
jgi:hypothetical protein